VIHTIAGIDYLSIKEFAAWTRHSKQAIRKLIETGNRIRKLQSIKDGVHTYIPFYEIADFPFCNQRGEVYHFDKHNPGVSYKEYA
jgi:hypothetical protein